MKKLSLFGALLLLLFTACEKEKEDPNDPIEITSNVQNVSIYGEADGMINLTVVGGTGEYSYLWSNEETTQNISNLAAGSYSVTVTDTDGDTQEHSAVVSEPEELMVTFNKVDESTLNASDGSISLEITGGITPYSVSWSNGSSEQSISGLSAGEYSVDITDAAGAIKSMDIKIFAPLTVSLETYDVSTFGGSDGAIDLFVAGGEEPYEISWSNESDVEDISDLEAGFFKVTITDNADNTKVLSTTVYEPYENESALGKIVEKTTRLRQSGIRIDYEGTIIYIDPINTTEIYTADADIVLITHNHDDHFKPSVIGELAGGNTTILAPSSCIDGIQSALPSAEVIEVAAASVDEVNGLEIETVYAYNNNHPEGAVGYIINLNTIRFYHAGDTKRIEEMSEYNADIACLPMGQTYTFPSIEEAAQAARDVHASAVIPMHYGMYEGSPGDPWIFKDLLEGEIDVIVKSSED